VVITVEQPLLTAKLRTRAVIALLNSSKKLLL